VRNDSDERPRLLLLVIFGCVFGLLLYPIICRLGEIDAGEKWARGAELVLIAVGAWVVVWPDSFSGWRSSRGLRGPDDRLDESRAEPGAAADRLRE